MCEIARKSGVTAIDFEGTRYDLGSKLGLMCANMVKAAEHPEIGEEFKDFLREFVKTL